MCSLARSTIAIALALAGCGAQPPMVPPPPANQPRPPPLAASAPPTIPAAARVNEARALAPVTAPPEAPQLPPAELARAAPAPAPAVMPSVTILAPAKNQVIPAGAAAGFQVKLRAQGWDLSKGNAWCVRIDKHPCRRVTDLAAPLALGAVDPTLDEGQHVITVLARRPSGESVKPAGKRAAFASHSFYVGKKTAPVWKDGGPMLLFDAPADGPAPAGGVLLDFYVANADVARGKHVVHASIGGPGLGVGAAMVVDGLTPLVLQNPRPGEYLVRFVLHGYRADLAESGSSTTVSYSSAPVPGAFSEVTRSFRVTGAGASPR